VTQKQFKTVMGYNPSHFSKDGTGEKDGKYPSFSKPGGGAAKVKNLDTGDFPVENVSYEDALKFCGKLNEKEKKTLGGWKYSLPTEAQWEYACRGGASSYQKYHFGDSISKDDANFGWSKGRTCEVGSYKPNAFGLYDMHGNVAEWCLDWYDQYYYADSPKRDPSGPLEGKKRVNRGSNWYDEAARACRSALRFYHTPETRNHFLGFRVALVPAK
jgi:formylglycine-generating enzyme required for sulfatase activity